MSSKRKQDDISLEDFKESMDQEKKKAKDAVLKALDDAYDGVIDIGIQNPAARGVCLVTAHSISAGTGTILQPIVKVVTDIMKWASRIWNGVKSLANKAYETGKKCVEEAKKIVGGIFDSVGSLFINIPKREEEPQQQEKESEEDILLLLKKLESCFHENKEDKSDEVFRFKHLSKEVSHLHDITKCMTLPRDTSGWI